MNTDFYSMVMKHFSYLTTSYGFVVKNVTRSERRPMTEGRVEFESTTSFVTVSGEQGAAGAVFGRVQDDKYKYFLSPTAVYEYYSFTESEKRLACSVDPNDDRKIRILAYEKRLVPSETNANNAAEVIERDLADYSNWLRQYSEPFLRGDFSSWLEIYEYKVNRNRSAYARSGKKEFVPAGSQDKDHRESVFRSSLAYLERLRKEK